jgi:hypothetical protein
MVNGQVPRMRGWGICATLLLAACIPSERKGARTPDARAGPAQPDKEILQCFADLRREEIGFRPLPDRRFANGCSAVNSVQLLEIGTPVTNLGAMTCPVARQFGRWAREAMQPAASAWLGSRVVRIESFGTYSCRAVNSVEGARLSEHGRANAVDIGAFVLADGRRIKVLDGWNSEDKDVRRFLRAVHQAACRRFQIVIGPDADSFHRDHLHFDMGQGPYCR